MLFTDGVCCGLARLFVPVAFLNVLKHYENLPIQYIAIFAAVKMEKKKSLEKVC